MILLEDSRQQEGKHKYKAKYFEDHGITVSRTKLWVGDYTLPTNQSICIDTKKDMQEIVGNLCGKEHERFRDECVRAQEAGIKLIVLVEEPGINELRDVRLWQNPRRKIMIWKDGKRVQKYPRATKGITLMKAMYTMQLKYGVEFRFCDPKDAGKVICEILGIKGEFCDGQQQV